MMNGPISAGWSGVSGRWFTTCASGSASSFCGWLPLVQRHGVVQAREDPTGPGEGTRRLIPLLFDAVHRGGLLNELRRG